jgi:hypothetical protein
MSRPSDVRQETEDATLAEQYREKVGSGNVPAVLTFEHKDPTELGFPHLLPLELALAESSPREICNEYGIDKDQFKSMLAMPAFQKAYADAKNIVANGMGFRVKAQLQAEALLKTSWALIHSSGTPSHVKADLIKQTWKVAGYEPKDEKGPLGAGGLQINIQLNN